MSPFRRRRSIGHPDVLHYKLHAFGSKLQLRLKRNLNLMSPNFVIERHHRGGIVTTEPAPRNKYYLGKVLSDPDSLVALRSDKGLVRAIKEKPKLFSFQHTLLENYFRSVGWPFYLSDNGPFLSTLFQLTLDLCH